MPKKNIKTWKELGGKRKKKLRKSKGARSAGERASHEAERVFDDWYADELEKGALKGAFEKKSAESASGSRAPSAIKTPDHTKMYRGSSAHGKKKAFATPHERIKPFRGGWLLAFAVAGALVAGASGVFLFGSSKTSKGVEINFTAPGAVVSGEEFELEVAVTNKETSILKDLEISVQWPAEIKVVSAEPAAVNSSQSVWQLPSLSIGETTSVRVKAQLFGKKGENKNIKATLVYQLENFSSDFIAEKNIAIQISDPTTTLTVEGEDEVEPLREGVWKFVLRNNGNETLQSKKLRLILPSVFEAGESEPAFSRTSDAWSKTSTLEIPLDALAPQQSQEIELKGKFQAGSQGVHTVVWRIGYADQDEFVVQQEGNFDIAVVGDEAEVSLLVNGQENPPYMIWGDRVEVELAVKNITSEVLHDFSWEVAMTPSVFDWNTFSSPFTAIQEKPGLLRFSFSDNEALQNLEPSETALISFSVALKPQPAADSFFSISAQMFLGDISFTKELKDILIKQQVTWDTRVQYFDEEGVQVGIGPLPPHVGETTTFRVQWEVFGIEEGIDDIEISALVSPSAQWVNIHKVNAGKISYDAVSRQVSWHLPRNSFPALASGSLQADWQVGVLPGPENVGSIMPLTGQVVLQALKGGKTVSFQKEALTTALKGDAFAQGKGIVVGNK